MIENPVKHTLAAGGVAVGAMLFEFATHGAPRIIAAAGADFALFDQEHTGWSIETLKPLFEGARVHGVVPLVRVPTDEAHLIGAALDAGAMGVMLPRVDDAAQATRIVEAAKFPPRGRRSYGFVDSAYLHMDQAALMNVVNTEQLVIAQIESAAGVDHADEIAAVDGVDVLWLGPNDLAASLGIPGGFDRPEYEQAVEHVVAAARSHGKTAAISAASSAQAGEFIARGFRCLSYRDVSTFEQSLRVLVEGARAAATASAGATGATSPSRTGT